jgi:chromosome segregation ATPase
MSYTTSIAELDESVYALQRHYDAIHRRAEGSDDYARDLTYRLGEIKTTLKDAVACDATFSNEAKRTAEVARRLAADFQDLVDDEAKASRVARQDRLELERSEQALKTARARLITHIEREVATVNHDTARLRLAAAQTERESAMEQSPRMIRTAR